MTTAAVPSRVVAVRDPVIAGILGTLLNLVAITTPSVWYDEAATVSASTRSLPELWDMAKVIDVVHLVYYVGMHFVFEVFGYSVVTLRVPSAIAVGVTAALVVVLARQLRVGRFPLVAGIVFCVLPRVTWMGIEGRSYAFTALFAALTTVLLLRASRSRHWGWWAGYGVAAAAGCFVFIFFWLVVLAHGVALLFWRRSLPRRAMLGWAVSAAAASVALIPLLQRVLDQRGQVAWLRPLTWDSWSRFTQDQWFADATWAAVLTWASIVLGVITCLRRPEALSPAPLVLAGLLVPTAGLIAASLVVQPLYEPRYLSFSTPFVALGIACGIAAFRWAWVQAIAVIALAALVVPTYLDQRTPDSKVGSDWASVAAQVVATRDDAVPTGVAYGRLALGNGRAVQVAYPAAFVGMIDTTLDQTAVQRHNLWASEVPLDQARLDGVEVLYVLDSATIDYPGWQATDRWTYPDMVLTRLEREG